MNKKIILKIVILIFSLWAIFVIIDCFRMHNLGENSGGKPLITLYAKKYENIEQVETSDGKIEVGESGTIYIGLGYTKKYYKKWQIDKSVAKLGYSLDLFGFITIDGFEYQ